MLKLQDTGIIYEQIIMELDQNNFVSKIIYKQETTNNIILFSTELDIINFAQIIFYVVKNYQILYNNFKYSKNEKYLIMILLFL